MRHIHQAAPPSKRHKCHVNPYFTETLQNQSITHNAGQDLNSPVVPTLLVAVPTGEDCDGTDGGGWCSRTRPAWCHNVSRNTDCTGCTAHTYGGLSPTIFLSSTSALTSPHSSWGLDGTGVAGFLQPSPFHVIHLPCDLNHFEAYANTEEYDKLHLGLMHSYPRSSMSSL